MLTIHIQTHVIGQLKEPICLCEILIIDEAFADTTASSSLNYPKMFLVNIGYCPMNKKQEFNFLSRSCASGCRLRHCASNKKLELSTDNPVEPPLSSIADALGFRR